MSPNAPANAKRRSLILKLFISGYGIDYLADAFAISERVVQDSLREEIREMNRTEIALRATTEPAASESGALRVCTRCGPPAQPITQFPLDRSKTAGRGYVCKACARKINRDKRDKRKQELQELRAQADAKVLEQTQQPATGTSAATVDRADVGAVEVPTVVHDDAPGDATKICPEPQCHADGEPQRLDAFYQYRNGTPHKYCKQCAGRHVREAKNRAKTASAPATPVMPAAPARVPPNPMAGALKKLPATLAAEEIRCNYGCKVSPPLRTAQDLLKHKQEVHGTGGSADRSLTGSSLGKVNL